MKATLFSIVAFAATVATAQTTSACAADYIVEACLSTENARLATCATTDYDCQCAAWGSILTCFNNCPNDQRAATYAGQKQIFCGYASQFPSSTTKLIISASTTVASTIATSTTGANTNEDTTDDTTNTDSTATATATSTSVTGTAATASSTPTNAAADLAMNAGRVLAAVAGVVVAVL
ncbi:hypothetical protein B0T17DRAFT_375746 [Bombardia bombarda]|uniref:GPI anchored serine-threonine rich protein n=1 Tax=Bombardia bombarda TaxID=252184 RepID=A0AA39WGK7_9PEZI|nr:hypothetical protein B0T17DRAFT_375746 [Bombardia bombarda]